VSAWKAMFLPGFIFHPGWCGLMVFEQWKYFSKTKKKQSKKERKPNRKPVGAKMQGCPVPEVQ
jgi:hypothetical protein